MLSQSDWLDHKSEASWTYLQYAHTTADLLVGLEQVVIV